MSKHLVPALAVLLLAASSGAQAPTPTIEHQPVACAAAGKFPRLEARFSPSGSVASARVVFQGQSPEWYAVAMKSEGATFVGVLPKPKRSLKSFRYYIEVTDKALGTNRTADYTASVVESSSACQGRILAGALASAAVVLQGPAGAVGLPVGFASAGVVAAGSSAGTAGAAVGGGGSLSTGAVVGIVGGVGAAAVAAVAAKGGGGGGGPNTLEGTVFRNASPPSPISGAVVSTSLDSRTTTTDGSGHFRLETATGGNVQVYRVTVTTAGCQTYNNESGWGAHPTGLTLQLTCP